jgi:hypothetical protein
MMGVPIHTLRRCRLAALGIILFTIAIRLPSLVPSTYASDVQADSNTAQYPVNDFPILAKLLAEQYQPAAHTAEGVIYRMH